MCTGTFEALKQRPLFFELFQNECSEELKPNKLTQFHTAVRLTLKIKFNRGFTMKNTNIITLASSIFAASLLISSPTHASVKTAGQATSLCKAQAEKAHPGYKRSKSVKIKQTRGVFKIKMKVITETESVIAFCEVNKEGEISYAKA